MMLDLRSLVAWVRDIFGRGRLAGRVPIGTPNLDLDEAPPSLDREANRVVFGGGTALENIKPAPEQT